VLRVEALLEVGHPLGVCEHDPLRRVSLKTDGFGWIIVGQIEAHWIIYPEGLNEVPVPQNQPFDGPPATVRAAPGLRSAHDRTAPPVQPCRHLP
jgi:hypothetical protein